MCCFFTVLVTIFLFPFLFIKKSSSSLEGYNRFAKIYDFLEKISPMEKYKKELISSCYGKTLEVGIGSGLNIKHYSENLDVVGIDYSNNMLKLAQKRKEALKKKNIVLKLMDIEKLEFSDNSFDTIISTCVFCSIPNPEKGIQEVFRVLKPGGQLLMIEHTQSSNKFINFLLKILNYPVYRFLGTSLLRETHVLVKKIGFEDIIITNIFINDVFKKIAAIKPIT